jgi:outer membrane lipoprotein-sorting protein
MTRRREVLLALLLLLSMMACAPRFHQPPAVDGVLPTRSAEDILAPFDQRWQRLEEVRALARVSVTSQQGRFSTRQTFLWHRPSLIRLDTVSLFGQPTMTVVADATQVSIYDPSQGTFFRGPSSTANLARFIGLPLATEDLAHLLTGYIRPGPGAPIAGIHVQADDGTYLLRFLHPGGGLLQDAWVDPSQWLPTRVVRYGPHTLPVLDILYGDFRILAESIAFPFRLAIWLPRTDTEILIQFLDVDLNPGLPLSVFQLSPPEGTPIVPLE